MKQNQAGQNQAELNQVVNHAGATDTIVPFLPISNYLYLQRIFQKRKFYPIFDPHILA
jgi:hypothetical protein